MLGVNLTAIPNLGCGTEYYITQGVPEIWFYLVAIVFFVYVIITQIQYENLAYRYKRLRHDRDKI